MQTGRIALSLGSVTVHYGRTPAVEDVTLPIHRDGVTAIVGPSGCGKTSLLMAMNRLTDLVPGCRVSGSLRLGDQEVTSPSCDVVALRRRIGMVFQKANPFPFSIRRNLELPLREHGLRSRRERGERMEQALRDAGLWDEVRDRLDRPAPSLSGGQQQRLCIARAVALRPEVLLMDEPTSNLDPLAAGVIEDRILSLRDQLTIVVVTHNLAQARRIADEVAVMWVRNGSGTLIERGTTKEIFETPRDEMTAAYVNGARG